MSLIMFSIILSMSFLPNPQVLEIDLYEGLEIIILIVTGFFSLLLLGLSLYAYKSTRLKSIIFAAGAFGLFALQLFLKSLEETYEFLDTEVMSLLITSITLGILVLFFLAIVKKNN